MFDAREYLRVSDDKSGSARSTTEQHDENQEAAGDRDWSLGKPYTDVDRSASRFARKAREGYDDLMDDLQADRFNARYLILWEASRGGREIEEWVRLVKLCERRGVQFYITSDDLILDPRRDSDFDRLITLGQQSEAESRKTSKRVKRNTKAAAAQGRPHGQTPYGYVRRYEFITGKGNVLVEQAVHEIEGPVIGELFDRLAQGHSLYGIAKDYRERGITRRDGEPFSQQHLRNLARRDCYVGKRIYIAGRGTAHEKKAELVDAMWPGIVAEDTWHAVQRLMDDPARTTRRPGGTKWLYSLIVKCDPCGAYLTVLPPGGEGKNLRKAHGYRCSAKGCVKVEMTELDDFLSDAIVRYLSREDVYKSLADNDEADQAELSAVRGQLIAARNELDELADALGRNEISAVMAGRAEAAKLERIEALEAREVELATPSFLKGLLKPGQDVRRWWDAAELSTKREVARVLLSPAKLGEARVMRSVGRGTPAWSRVRWVRT